MQGPTCICVLTRMSMLMHTVGICLTLTNLLVLLSKVIIVVEGGGRGEGDKFISSNSKDIEVFCFLFFAHKADKFTHYLYNFLNSILGCWWRALFNQSFSVLALLAFELSSIAFTVGCLAHSQHLLSRTPP